MAASLEILLVEAGGQGGPGGGAAPPPGPAPNPVASPPVVATTTTTPSGQTVTATPTVSRGSSPDMISDISWLADSLGFGGLSSVIDMASTTFANARGAVERLARAAQSASDNLAHVPQPAAAPAASVPAAQQAAPLPQSGPVAQPATRPTPQPTNTGGSAATTVATTAAGQAATAAVPASGATAAASTSAAATTAARTTTAATGAAAASTSGSAAATGAIASLAAAAGPAAVAVGAVAVAAGLATLAVKALASAIRTQVDALAKYSAEISEAQARTEVMMTMAQIRRAESIGPQLAEAENVLGRAEQAFYDLGTQMFRILLDFLSIFKPIIERGIATVEFMSAGLEVVITKIEEFYGTMTANFELANKAAADSAKAQDKMAKAMKEMIFGLEEPDDNLVDPFLEELLNAAAPLGMPNMNIPRRAAGGA